MIFVHGVIETDEWWSGPARARAGDPTAIGEDFGTRLTRDLASTVQIRYNSGRHVSHNGADLADLLDELVTAWPRPVRRLVLVGHSMGGLVARSALHQAFERGRTWPHRTRHLVCLGTPHTGAPLERGANALAWGLRQLDESAPFAALLAARSAGIKDMRHGASTSRTGTAPTRMHCTETAALILTSHPRASGTATSPQPSAEIRVGWATGSGTCWSHQQCTRTDTTSPHTPDRRAATRGPAHPRRRLRTAAELATYLSTRRSQPSVQGGHASRSSRKSSMPSTPRANPRTGRMMPLMTCGAISRTGEAERATQPAPPAAFDELLADRADAQPVCGEPDRFAAECQATRPAPGPPNRELKPTSAASSNRRTVSSR